jgi:hypothetical protein
MRELEISVTSTSYARGVCGVALAPRRSESTKEGISANFPDCPFIGSLLVFTIAAIWTDKPAKHRRQSLPFGQCNSDQRHCKKSLIGKSSGYFGSSEMQASSYLPEPMAPSGKIPCLAIQPNDFSNRSFV